jgi:hypothetical protein
MALQELSSKHQQLLNRYAPVASVEQELTEVRNRLGTEIDKLRGDLVAERKRLEEWTQRSDAERTKLAKDYQDAQAVYGTLKQEIALLEENLEDISFGLYRPHFTFETSEEYKAARESARNKARELARSGKAANCPVPWKVGDSRKDGERMVKQYSKLLLRAFNGECDAAIANVSWNNITKMEERIRKAFDAVNELGSVMQVSVVPAFMRVRIDELRLTHEYAEKRHDEREEERKIREQIREEEKARREFEKAQAEAEQEEERYRQALERARREAAEATGTQLDKLSRQIASLESRIDEAHMRRDRAIARAQLTRSGFVYVISNIGSFGERIYKIGMTRRMEPMDRIRELGDASVPFPFDLHVMMYSDNAPELEGAIHALFEGRRVNLVNPRKEFYREVELDEIEKFVRGRGLSAQFMKIPEAKEYRETLAQLKEREVRPEITTQVKFPSILFAGPSSEVNLGEAVEPEGTA